MLKLFFDLKHQNITLTNPGVTVASDSKNYLVAKFNTISDDWETPLSAIFVSTVDKIAYTVLVGQSSNLEPDECFVPWEVLKDSGDVYVSVFSGNLHTTNTAKFAVVKSGYIEGEIPPPPTPTVYEQILEELENKQDVIHLDNTIDTEYNPNGHYVLYYFDNQDIRHNIFDFEVFQELAEEKIYEILDYTLQGDPNIAPSLYIEANQGGSYSLVYMDSDDQKHVIFDFSNLPLGTSDYDDLSNRPQINGHTLTGNKSSGDLNLQEKLVVFSEYLRIYQAIDAQVLDFRHNDFFRLRNLYNSPFTDGSGYDFVDIPEYLNNLFDNGYIPVKKLGNYFSFSRDFVNGEKLVDLYYLVPTTGELYHRSGEMLNNGTETWGNWHKISGGSQIVSGVVNQNGTITFTDSDGNTFTTSGSSVIGADGFSPTATVTQTQSGATVSITDKNGTTTANISNGADGQDYVLTNQDKTDIANIVLQLLPTTQGVLYGNASN